MFNKLCTCAYTWDLLSAPKSSFTSTTIEQGLANTRMSLEIKHSLMLSLVLSSMLFSCHKITMIQFHNTQCSQQEKCSFQSYLQFCCFCFCVFPFLYHNSASWQHHFHLLFCHLLHTGHQNPNYNPITEKNNYISIRKVRNAFKVAPPGYFVRVPSYFEALWYSHHYIDRKSNIIACITYRSI